MSKNKPFGLSEKEKRVATYLIKGVTNRYIAAALGLKEVTIKMHMTSIIEKTGSENRTGAALNIQERYYKRMVKRLKEEIKDLKGEDDE